MKTKIYVNNEKIIAGMTLKDETAPEQNNMALHACQSREHVVQNRKQLASSLNVDLDLFVCSDQTHSANFYQVTKTDQGRGAFNMDTAIPCTDALYTSEPDLVLCSFHADCVPIMFYHEGTGIAGVVHSGWQGTVKEISLKLFRHLVKEKGCRPEDFHIFIGSAISQEKFEVDEDVYEKYKKLGYADDFIDFHEQTGKYHIDNQLTVKQQCIEAGIPAERIHVDSTCTYKSRDGFSYREDRQSGRHLTFIMKK